MIEAILAAAGPLLVDIFDLIKQAATGNPAAHQAILDKLIAARAALNSEQAADDAAMDKAESDEAKKLGIKTE